MRNGKEKRACCKCGLTEKGGMRLSCVVIWLEIDVQRSNDQYWSFRGENRRQVGVGTQSLLIKPTSRVCLDNSKTNAILSRHIHTRLHTRIYVHAPQAAKCQYCFSSRSPVLSTARRLSPTYRPTNANRERMSAESTSGPIRPTSREDTRRGKRWPRDYESAICGLWTGMFRFQNDKHPTRMMEA